MRLFGVCSWYIRLKKHCSDLYCLVLWIWIVNFVF
uniref:Uncharacterized protein n=1 Tax=Populus trichocarpa TaxID=3694 RepID=A0A3N7ET71_POPTR